MVLFERYHFFWLREFRIFLNKLHILGFAAALLISVFVNVWMRDSAALIYVSFYWYIYQPIMLYSYTKIIIKHKLKNLNLTVPSTSKTRIEIS